MATVNQDPKSVSQNRVGVIIVAMEKRIMDAIASSERRLDERLQKIEKIHDPVIRMEERVKALEESRVAHNKKWDDRDAEDKKQARENGKNSLVISLVIGIIVILISSALAHFLK